jgi:hypothetical protein
MARLGFHTSFFNGYVLCSHIRKCVIYTEKNLETTISFQGSCILSIQTI